MIELANDPKASPPGWRAANGPEIGQPTPEAKRGRSGAPWPFPSRYAARPVQQDVRKPAANDSGS
jgi:hypothetical protein